MRKGPPVKIKSTSKAPKVILITGFALVVVTGGILGYLYVTQTGPFAPAAQGINYAPATSEEIKAGEDIKEQNSKTDTTGSDTSPAASQENTSKSTVGIEITAANQNGNTINVRTLIQTLSSSGSCTLSMTGPAGKTYNASAKTQSGPSSSTCMGFDIPTTSLSPGAWTMTINYEDSSSQGSVTKDLTVF